SLLVRGPRLLGSEPADLLLSGGRIDEIGPGLAEKNASVLAADGLIALPGLVDLHTHLREPGREDAETVESGTQAAALGGVTAGHAMGKPAPAPPPREPGRQDPETVVPGPQAAARGGFTAVHAMANTEPVADTAGVVEQVWRLGREAGFCDVYPVGAVTVGLMGAQLAALGAMADSAA